MQLTKHWASQLDDYIIDLAWSPDGATLAAASGAGGITLFGVAEGAKKHVLPGHEDGTNALAWRPDGHLFASGGQDGSVKFWDPATGQHTGTTAVGKAWVEHLAWRPAPPVVAGVKDPELVERADRGAPPVPVLETAAASVSTLAAASGRKLVFLNPDGSLRHSFPDAPKTISALAWQPVGGSIAAAHFGGVCLFDADDYVVQKEFPYTNGIHALVWSPDSRWLVSGNQDPSVHLWLPEEDQEFQMSGYEGKVKHLSFDRSSRWLATSGGRDACIWDCIGKGPEGREPQMFPHDTPVCAVSFQNNYSLLASASEDGVVMLWSPDRKQPLRATVRMPSAATKLAWSPDDSLLAIGSQQGIVYVLKCSE